MGQPPGRDPNQRATDRQEARRRNQSAAFTRGPTGPPLPAYVTAHTDVTSTARSPHGPDAGRKTKTPAAQYIALPNVAVMVTGVPAVESRYAGTTLATVLAALVR